MRKLFQPCDHPHRLIPSLYWAQEGLTRAEKMGTNHPSFGHFSFFHHPRAWIDFLASWESRSCWNLPLPAMCMCVHVCICRLNKFIGTLWNRFKVEPLEKSNNRNSSSVFTPRKEIHGHKVPQSQGEMIAAEGDVIFEKMFFPRRRILCVLTLKWSNCFFARRFLSGFRPF